MNRLNKTISLIISLYTLFCSAPIYPMTQKQKIILNQLVEDLKTGKYLKKLNNKEVVQQLINSLIENPANVFSPNIMGNQPIHIAAKYGDTKFVDALIELGANPNAFNIEYYTPLHLASMNDQYKVAYRLLKKYRVAIDPHYGIDIDTPFLKTIMGPNDSKKTLKILDLLIHNRAYTQTKTNRTSALQRAADHLKPNIFKFLIEHNFDPQRDMKSWTNAIISGDKNIANLNRILDIYPFFVGKAKDYVNFSWDNKIFFSLLPFPDKDWFNKISHNSSTVPKLKTISLHFIANDKNTYDISTLPEIFRDKLLKIFISRYFEHFNKIKNELNHHQYEAITLSTPKRVVTRMRMSKFMTKIMNVGKFEDLPSDLQNMILKRKYILP